MAGAVPVAELNAGFSSPGATARPWAEVSDVLTHAGIFWLSTVRGDGRPHVTPLPAVWHDGTLHFCTGDQEQKTRNLAANPRCVLTTGTPALRSGLDVIVEGAAVRVTGRERLTARAAVAGAARLAVRGGRGRVHRRGGADRAGVRRDAGQGPRVRQGRAVQPDQVPVLNLQTRYRL